MTAEYTLMVGSMLGTSSGESDDLSSSTNDLVVIDVPETIMEAPVTPPVVKKKRGGRSAVNKIIVDSSTD